MGQYYPAQQIASTEQTVNTKMGQYQQEHHITNTEQNLNKERAISTRTKDCQD